MSPTQTEICPGPGLFLLLSLIASRGSQILPQVSFSHLCYSYSHTSLVVGNPFCTGSSLISPHVYHNPHLFIEHLLYSKCFTQISLIVMSMQLSSYYYSHCTDEEFCQGSKKLNDLAKITQLFRDREGNQVQVCQAPKPVFCLLVHPALPWYQ